MSDIAAIIVSYNTAQLTLECVERLLGSSGVKLDIVIVDNNSTDQTFTKFKKKYSLKRIPLRPTNSVSSDIKEVAEVSSVEVDGHTITFLSCKENLGFGRGNNLGCCFSAAPFYFFVNTDAFVESGTAKKLLVAFNKNSEYGVLAAQLYNVDGTRQNQGGHLPTLWKIWRWFWFIDDLPFVRFIWNSYQFHGDEYQSQSKKNIQKMGWVGGTVMMIRADQFWTLGGFDPEIFMYAEDVDMCWRAAQRGWKSGLVNAGKVTHLGSASSGSKNAVHGEIKGLIYLWRKLQPSWQMPLLRFILWSGLWLRVLVFGILRQYGRQRIYREALALV